MGKSSTLKEQFEVEKQYDAFYTGGKVAWTSNGEEFVCQNNGKINAVNIDTGSVVAAFGDNSNSDKDEDVIYTFALSTNDEYILSAHRSGLIKMWDKRSGTIIKMWKGGHKGPVAALAFRDVGSVVASGGSDSSIRVWDHERKTCLCALKGSQGVVSLVTFHPETEKNLIFGAGDDNRINCWDYYSKDLIVAFEGHFSKVTAISIDNNSKAMVSVSRDKVLIMWNTKTGEKLKVLPLYETLEGICILPKTMSLPNGIDLSNSKYEEKIFAAVAGELGYIRIWNCTDGKVVFSQSNSSISKAAEEGGLAVTQLLYSKKTQQLAMVSADHNIIVHNISTFHCAKQLIGFSDEILDMCFLGKKSRYLAVATNSNDIKLYDTTNMNCCIVKGHSDIVLALASFKNLLLSSSKDNSIRLWEIDPGSFTVRSVATGTKHTASVGSVAFGKNTHTFCVSVSQDTCLKVWIVPKSFPAEETDLHTLKCKATVASHDKDVNCVTISPNDRLIATASQDKTAKLWNLEDLSLLGVLRGHKRGIWCIRFSPIDQVILTSSADCSLRLWSVATMTCLKVFEGHDSSVLRVEFFSKSMQFISAGGDGLIKLWNIKSGESALTLEKHDGRVWTIAIARDETHFVSGGSDSKLIHWKDVTEEKREAEIQERQEVAEQEQQLTNLISQKKMLKALKLALKLEKPHMAFKIVSKIIQSQETGLDETIISLNELHKEKLLNYAVTWNTNTKASRPAQLVINILMMEILANKFKYPGLKTMVEQTLPYTERHFRRVTKCLEELKFVEFTLNCMQLQSKMDVEEYVK